MKYYITFEREYSGIPNTMFSKLISANSLNDARIKAKAECIKMDKAIDFRHPQWFGSCHILGVIEINPELKNPEIIIAMNNIEIGLRKIARANHAIAATQMVESEWGR